MKMTGDDELDFLREAGSEVFNRQAKLAFWGIGIETMGILVFSGLVALLSTTVASWILVLGGGFVVVQSLLVGVFQWRARKSLKKHTKDRDALNAATMGLFG